MPGVAPTHERALALHRGGRLDEAAALYGEVLAGEPAHFGALHLLGVVHGQRGRYAQAVDLIEQAIRVDARVASAHAHLGNAQHALGRFDDALASYDRSLALTPGHRLALLGRGKALCSLRRLTDALASYEAALDVEPQCSESLMNRGDILLAIGRRSEGETSLRRAQACGADPERIRFLLASIGSEPMPSVAPAGYLRDLFNDFADRFDGELIGLLRYRVPELLAQRILRHSPPGWVDILDLGCGTGLCGTLLTRIARRLTGIDLSAAMLAKAHECGVYTELECVGITDYLAKRDREFDWVVAADVLVYFGDLAPVFAGVRRVLRAGGCFVFSVEAAEQADVELAATRRYRHSRPYLDRLAGEHGFTVDALENHVLRLEAGQAVNGHLACLRLDAEVAADDSPQR